MSVLIWVLAILLFLVGSSILALFIAAICALGSDSGAKFDRRG